MLKKPPEFGGLTHKIRKIVFSCFRCPVFAFLVSRLNAAYYAYADCRYLHRHLPVQESVQVQDAIVWWGFCAIRRGFQVFYPANVRRSKKCETLSSLRLTAYK